MTAPPTREPMPEAKIELQNVKKAFGNKKVLDGVDLLVPKGKSVVIIGGSGTGKSVTSKIYPRPN